MIEPAPRDPSGRRPHSASARIIAICAAVAAASAAAVYAISRLTPTTLVELTRDPASSFEFPVYAGLLSTTGMLLWAATGAICLFGARQADPAAPGRRLLRDAGWLTVLLCLDDAFLLHEEVFPNAIPLRGVEYMVYAAYAAAMTGVLFVNRRAIARTEFPILIAALGCFAVSIGLDKVVPYRFADGTVNQIPTFVEDAFKFCGILLWLAYYSRAASATLGSRAPAS